MDKSQTGKRPDQQKNIHTKRQKESKDRQTKREKDRKKERMKEKKLLKCFLVYFIFR